ncbi:VCBS repeat-containing protein [Amycolatopsis balhimycina DSM 5908]|uniref:VCBS repeat-containing protein n=1 Tax=Amycolatopsis balhimycina DSM 5908 TaxID=1081091 RepID=A0A428W066_AMYBA|nr:VCBS repeat-containing protein [Amycolatopsis balhimycina]RSM36458.1 VCBS repeat-containing protein [Amycolatopsis balhimycina DSM 5908]
MSLSTGGSLYLAQHSGTVNGAATFRPEKNIANGWQSASLILVTDFLGKDRNNPTELDGLADILFRVPTDNEIYLYVNQGLDSNGNLTFFSWGKLLNDTQAVTSMAAADVTADGFPDLYTTFTDGSARLLDFFAEQDSSGNWIPKWYTITATGADVYDTRLLTDVNDVGFPDLLTRTKATGELDVALHARNWNPAAIGRLRHREPENTRHGLGGSPLGDLAHDGGSGGGNGSAAGTAWLPGVLPAWARAVDERRC